MPGKRARTVLRGPRRSNALGLPDNTAADHIETAQLALAQLPRGKRERQWITARRSELDALAGELAKQAQEVQAERDELAIAERVLNRLAEHTRPTPGLSLRYR